MRISSEYLESIISNWAKNLWMLNNQPRIYDDQSQEAVIQEFYNLYYPNNRGLTHTQNLSERGFTGLCQGLAYLDNISEKAFETLSKNSLVDAWRQSVMRTAFQQKYTFFEKILKDTLDTHGNDAAVAQYPVEFSAPADDVIEALEAMRYNAKFLRTQTIKDLIRQAGNGSPAHQPKSPPKGPQTK